MRRRKGKLGWAGGALLVFCCGCFQHNTTRIDPAVDMNAALTLGPKVDATNSAPSTQIVDAARTGTGQTAGTNSIDAKRPSSYAPIEPDSRFARIDFDGSTMRVAKDQPGSGNAAANQKASGAPGSAFATDSSQATAEIVDLPPPPVPLPEAPSSPPPLPEKMPPAPAVQPPPSVEATGPLPPQPPGLSGPPSTKQNLPDAPPTPPSVPRAGLRMQPEPQAVVQNTPPTPEEPPPPPAPVVKDRTDEPPPLPLTGQLPTKNLQPVSNAAPGKPAGDLQTIHQLAAQSYASIDSYIVRFKRREQVNGKDMPEELMLLKFRKQPMSVYFKWLAGAGVGREAVYVQGRYGDKLHTRVAAGDIPLIPGGKKLSLAIDSAMVRSRSRHSITEAGIGHSIEQFGNLVDNMKNKDYRFGSLKYLGLIKRPEFDAQVEAVLQIVPPKAEPNLPKGGRRFWYFDTRLRFPVLMITYDEQQHEVEYYCLDRWLFPGRLSEDEFNPNVLWREN